MARSRAQNEHGDATEQSPLLSNGGNHDVESDASSTKAKEISFGKDDAEDPRQWKRSRKMLNVAIIALMAVLSPLASSMFTPGISEIANHFKVEPDSIVGATTGFVVMLGIGPLILAPLSETFGRRTLYIICFGCFSLLQVPTALSPNLETMLVCRTLAGFFGSVGISNGGGTISDMFQPSERAGIFGWYLLGPLLGPTLGPLFGGIILEYLNWRWLFWILTIVCSINTILGFFFLKESYAPVLLQRRCDQYSKEDGGSYTYEGQDRRPFHTRILQSVKRPLYILLTQPIVLTMALWHAIIFATMYSLFTNMDVMYGKDSPYHFSTLKVGLLYLGPGMGFLLSVWFLVPRIDTVFNKMSERNDGKEKPEYRLPLANIGAVLLPASLFWFGWTVQRTHWLVSVTATVFFGFGQVAIFNTVQNYYIDSFAKYAASAIAAGAVFRSIVGGIVPLLAPKLFEKLGYGWGWSVFGFLTLLMSPVPTIFMRYGQFLRERFAIEL